MQFRALGIAALVLTAGTASAQFEVTLFHNNDAESRLVGSSTSGGADRFLAVLARERAALGMSANTLTISSGDNFLAGRNFAASLANLEADPTNGVIYDAQVLEAVGYDAVVLGNHEFDFGPSLLSTFIERSNDEGVQTTFLSANLDFSASTSVSATAKSNIAKSTIKDFGGGNRVAVIGATTPFLNRISSVGDVIVDTDVVNAVQAEIDRLRDVEGVNNVVLASHLQSVNEDVSLISQLRGVDFAIAGGGDELLANPGTPLLPGDMTDGPYPITTTDLDGNTVNIVTTAGAYNYLGRITLQFDGAGNLAGFDNASIGPDRVIDASTGEADGVVGDAAIRANIVDPVAAFSAALDTQVLATTSENVLLDGNRSVVRTRESGMGNLAADALFDAAAQEIAGFGTVNGPAIAFQNGGGIRNNVVIGPNGEITAGDTFDILPFSNFVAVFEDVPVQDIVIALENAVSRVEFVDGRFSHFSGLKFVWDDTRPGSQYDAEGNLISVGSRIVDVELADGTVLVEDGVIVSDLLIDVATIDFLARGGDFFDLPGDFTRTGISYQQALANFLTALAGPLDGEAYTEFGEGRITQIPAPSGVVILGLAGLAASRRRR